MLLSERELQTSEHHFVENHLSGHKQMLKSRNEMQKEKKYKQVSFLCFLFWWVLVFCSIKKIKQKQICAPRYFKASAPYYMHIPLMKITSHYLCSFLQFYTSQWCSSSFIYDLLYWNSGKYIETAGGARNKSTEKRKTSSLWQNIYWLMSLSVPQRENNKAFQIQTGSHLKLQMTH